MTTDCPSVLLVDDVDTFRETIRLELEDRGYGVRRPQMREAVAMGSPHLHVRGARPEALWGRWSSAHSRGETAPAKREGRHPHGLRFGRLGRAGDAARGVELPHQAGQYRPARARRGQTRSIRRMSRCQTNASLARHEREYLGTCCGSATNITQAAKWLGIHRQSLQRKLRKYPPQK